MLTSSLPGGPLCHLTSFPTLDTSSSLVSLVGMSRAQLVDKRQRRHDAIKTALISFFLFFLRFFFFLMCTIFKVFIEFVIILLLFYVFVHKACGHLTPWMRPLLVAQSCLPLCRPMKWVAHQALCPWDSPGKNTGMGSHSLLQGIFLTQWSNQDLLHCRWILYHWAT